MTQRHKSMCAVLLACAFIWLLPLSANAKKPPKPPPPDPGGGSAEIVTGPYLQNATDTSMVVMWESTAETNSSVEFGPTTSLGTIVDSVSPIPHDAYFIHEVALSGLSPDTVYYYKVKTESAESAINRFSTLPSPGANKPVRFAVYSDVQKNKSSPDKHLEIVNDGIIGYITGTLGLDLLEGLDLVLVAGDLVDKGYSERDWTTYFQEADNLQKLVPYFPETGNHEYDNFRYFNYMSLPENGTPGFEEHWYYVDLANVRIIGIDSNKYYNDEPSQLLWLDDVLADAANDPDIDVVFVQMHHPYLTELWLDGETPFSGEIISRLEQFSIDSGKPSMHFTGHTHGYSRGQSLDASHSWITVASGEGDIDYWGDYANADREPIEMSLPEWGFMIIEVDDVGVHVQRLSRGNDVLFKDNEVVDEFTILFNNTPPSTPTDLAVAPHGGGEATLSASSFIDVDPVGAISYCNDELNPFDGHIESQFQVSDDIGFSNLIVDKLIRFENLYSPPNASGERNGYYSDVTCAGDMTSLAVDGLPAGTPLFYRVRYRDDSLGWSDWAAPLQFTL